MNRVVVTGLGMITSIGNTTQQVTQSLRELKHGFEPFPAVADEDCPPKLYGSIKEFDTTSIDQEDWTYPDRYNIRRAHRKTMAPQVLFSHCAMLDAVNDAGLELSEISNPRTGMYSASSGSPRHQFDQLDVMNNRGITRCSPFGVVVSTVGTINFNLAAAFKIKGSVCGMASACASAAHAIGFAFDEIAMGRQDRMIVIGSEDGNRETLLPFAAMRALSTKDDPKLASCPFDVKRSGFVGCGGATTLILESEQLAKQRKAEIYSELAGWGQAADGHSPAISHPRGEGLVNSINLALQASKTSPSAIDYINAHGTSTPVGDLAEIRAMNKIWDGQKSPMISSTKAITGHGLSLAGALEAGISCLAIKEEFTPGNAHLETPEPEAEPLNIIPTTEAVGPETVLSNSSGFGGANVSLVFRRYRSS